MLFSMWIFMGVCKSRGLPSSLVVCLGLQRASDAAILYFNSYFRGRTRKVSVEHSRPQKKQIPRYARNDNSLRVAND